MTRTRYLLRDIGGALPEGALLAFVRHLPPDSALKCEIDPDNVWLSGIHSDMLLAAIADQLAGFEYAYLKANGAKPRKPKPIPRPGVSDGTQRIGREAIDIAQFNDWYYGGD